MRHVNALVGGLIDAALSPFESLPPIVGLSAVSLAVAVAMLLAMRLTTNQRAIAAVKRRIEAAFFEVRLFNDDVRALHALGDVLRHNLSYFRLSLAPLPWVAVPLVLLIAHLQFYYGYDGFAPTQSTVLKVRLKESAVLVSGAAPSIEVVAPPGITIQTPHVWIPGEREAAWRIGFDHPGEYELTVTAGASIVSKRIRVSDQLGWRTPGRYAAGWLNEVLYPAEPPIDGEAPIESIIVHYGERKVSIFGMSTGWLVVFFVLTLLFAWILRSRFGVVI